MNRKRTTFTLVLISLCLIASGLDWASTKQGAERPMPSSNATSNIRPEGKPWPDWLVIHGNQYLPVVDELGRNLQLARESFLQTDFHKAAKETRKAAAFLAQERGTVSKADKKESNLTVRDLSRLADRLDRQSVKSLESLDEVFARAHQLDIERTWAVVGFERWTPIATAPDAHLRLARQDLLQKDIKASTAEIRKVKGLLRLEALRATSEGKQELLTSAEELKQLAGKMDRGSATNPQDLQNPFAAAQYALAKSYCAKARQDWLHRESANTGQELQASVLNLTEGAEWAGHGAGFDSSLVVKDALELSKRLINKSPEKPTSVTSELKAVGDEIENLRKRLHLTPDVIG
jgi:hypothetical protein